MLKNKSRIFTVQRSSPIPKQGKGKKNNYNQKFANKRDGSKTKKFHKSGWILQSTNKSNNKEDADCRSTDGVYGLLVLVIVAISPLSITLLPANNVITNPEYWYELSFSTSSFYLFMALASATEMTVLLSGIINKGYLSSVWISF